jgi:hypothetical protein
MSAGFYKRRRGILEHIEAGEIDLLESGIHDYLSLKANLLVGSPSSIPVGIVFTSAPAIHAHCKRVSERTIQRILEHLEEIGWLKNFRTANQRGNYPLLICRASVHDLSGNEYRINADATTDWRHPVYEAVRRVSPETSNVVGKVAGIREERVGKGRKKNLAAAPPDPRHKPFCDFAYEAFRMKYLQAPTWDGRHGNGLRAFLNRNSNITLDEWQRRYRNFLASTDAFYQQQKGSVLYFAANFDRFIDGPILEKGTSNGKSESFDERRRRESEEAIRRVHQSADELD